MERGLDPLAAIMGASRAASAAEHAARALIRADCEADRLAAGGRLRQRLAEVQDRLAEALRLLEAPPPGMGSPAAEGTAARATTRKEGEYQNSVPRRRRRQGGAR